MTCTTSIVWMKDNMSLTNPCSIDLPDSNLVILGFIQSTSSIAIKVKNLVVLGGLTAEQGLKIETSSYIKGGFTPIASVIKADKIYESLDASALQKMRELGMEVEQVAGGLKIVRPKRHQSLSKDGLT